MMCEYCGKHLLPGDTVHGIKFGTLGNDRRFKPSIQSAPTTLCGNCGNDIYRIVYGSMKTNNLTYQEIFKMLDDVRSLMKNGYKFAQGIASLPPEEQSTLKRIIAICKIKR
jgi:hypothetical protein